MFFSRLSPLPFLISILMPIVVSYIPVASTFLIFSSHHPGLQKIITSCQRKPRCLSLTLQQLYEAGNWAATLEGWAYQFWWDDYHAFTSYFGDKVPGFWPIAIGLMWWVLYSSNCGWSWSVWRFFNQYNGTAQGLNTALVMDWFSPTWRVSDVHFRKFH